MGFLSWMLDVKGTAELCSPVEVTDRSIESRSRCSFWVSYRARFLSLLLNVEVTRQRIES